MGERNISVRKETLIDWLLPTGDQAHSQGMCPVWESQWYMGYHFWYIHVSLLVHGISLNQLSYISQGIVNVLCGRNFAKVRQVVFLLKKTWKIRTCLEWMKSICDIIRGSILSKLVFCQKKRDWTYRQSMVWSTFLSFFFEYFSMHHSLP